jgi:hypothetical protein
MHPLQDLQFWWHAGREWRGNDPFTNFDAIGHWFLDIAFMPADLWEAYDISRRYLRQQRKGS